MDGSNFTIENWYPVQLDNIQVKQVSLGADLASFAPLREHPFALDSTFSWRYPNPSNGGLQR